MTNLLVADVVWPALLLGDGLRTWQAIVLGFAVETAALAFVLGIALKRSLLASTLMNLASTLLGALAIPMLGLGWELTVGRVFWYVARVGTFNPFTWVATVLLATALNTAIEIIVVATVFDVPWTKRTVWVLFGANALSVGLAFYVVATSPFE